MNIINGLLNTDGVHYFIGDENGKRHFYGENIWSGYIKHFSGRKVFARHLPQKDYLTDGNIILIWPDMAKTQPPYLEIYYNESLLKYPASRFGHIAVNVNGRIYNYSVELNENELITPEEYFYRPALGEFGPGGVTRNMNPSKDELPYYDKFGRIFMRSIHILRIEGIDSRKIEAFFQTKLEKVRSSKPDRNKPGKYKNFSILSNSCTTIVRDGLRDASYDVKGLFPLDFFINAATYFITNPGNLKISLLKLNQLKVDEAQYSTRSRIMNIKNVYKYRKLKPYYREMDLI